MSWDLAYQHCAVLRASLEATIRNIEAISLQLAGLEGYVTVMCEREQGKTATIARPDSCNGIDQADCARLNADAVLVYGGMAGNGRACRGCGEQVLT